jgi:predicted secreted hydrolase
MRSRVLTLLAVALAADVSAKAPTPTSTSTPTSTPTPTPTSTSTSTPTSTATPTATPLEDSVRPEPFDKLRAGSRRRAEWRPADPDHRWEFPRDHHAHPGYRNEWWYFTGTVVDTAEPARRYGYQFTFFRVGLAPEAPRLDSDWAAADAVMGHLAVTDVGSGVHVFSEVIWRAVPLLGGFPAPPGPLLAWARSPAGTDGRWTLALEDGAFRISARDDVTGVGLDLVLRPTKPLVLQGPNGLARKSREEGYASLYYSHTRLATEGTLALGGKAARVRGESWMDKETGSFLLAPDQVGWDWFSLRLADGRDLMLYVLRREDGGVSFRTATLVDRTGRVRVLGAEAWSVRATGTWASEASGAVYPSGWQVEVPGEGIRLDVGPEVHAAENRSALLPGLSYWEGPVRVVAPDGAAAGEGYVELTGYAKGARLPL